MKIVHIADTHLGYSAYRKISENGFNQREEDVILSFLDAVDKIITMKPDVVLHSGDLFDSVRPTNRIVSIGIRELIRIYKAGIPLVLISGNHETPKQLYKGSIYSILEALPLDKKLFNIVYKDKYEAFSFDGLTVHAIPQCSNDEIFKNELKNIKLNPDTKNVLMLHAGVSGMREFSHGESNELLVDYDWLKSSKMDYIALGHYHNYINVVGNAWFSGSSERMSFNEVGQAKGFLEVDLSNEARTNLIKVGARPMIDIPPIDAAGKDSVVLLDEIIALIEKEKPSGKIIRMTAKNIPQHVMNSLDTKKIREAAKDAVHFEPKYEKLNEEGKLEEIKISSGGIREEFRSFLDASSGMEGPDRENFFQLWAQEYDKVAKEEEEQKQ
jgi:DNA repair exonuclease SbcCD nuclease subunit